MHAVYSVVDYKWSNENETGTKWFRYVICLFGVCFCYTCYIMLSSKFTSHMALYDIHVYSNYHAGIFPDDDFEWCELSANYETIGFGSNIASCTMHPPRHPLSSWLEFELIGVHEMYLYFCYTCINGVSMTNVQCIIDIQTDVQPKMLVTKILAKYT